MALLVCSGCSTRYAPGLEACPHCGGRERVEEGSPHGSRLPFLDVTCSTAGCRAEGVIRRIHMPMIVPGVVEQPAYACVPCGATMLIVGGWPPPGMGENMPKITRHGGATNAAADREQERAGRPPATGGTVQDAPPVGEDGPPPAVLPEREHQLDAPTEGVEMPADGTEPPEITGTGTALPLAEQVEDVPVAVGEIGPLTEEEAEQVAQIGAAHEGEAQHVSVLGEGESSPGNSSSISREKPPSSSETSESAPRKRARTTANRSKRARTASSTASSTDTSTGADTAPENE